MRLGPVSRRYSSLHPKAQLKVRNLSQKQVKLPLCRKVVSPLRQLILANQLIRRQKSENLAGLPPGFAMLEIEMKFDASFRLAPFLLPGTVQAGPFGRVFSTPMDKAKGSSSGRTPASCQRSARKASPRGHAGFLVLNQGDLSEAAFVYKATSVGLVVAMPHGNCIPTTSSSMAEAACGASR